MKHQSYYNRALQAQDRRFARAFEKMGYSTRDMVSAEPEPEVDDLTALRDEYKSLFGKKPFGGWDADKLREKIAEAGE